MPRKQSTLLKERKKSLSLANKQKNERKIEELSNDDKIFQLKQRIKLSEADLINFPGNKMIERKIQIFKNQLKELENKNDNTF